MIIKSYEIKKNLDSFLKNNIFLFYGENLGLKRDIKKLITQKLKQKNEKNIKNTNFIYYISKFFILYRLYTHF